MPDLETAAYVICLEYSQKLVNVYDAYMRERRADLAQIVKSGYAECIKMTTALRLGYLSPLECLEMVQAKLKEVLDELETAFADSMPHND